MEFHILYINISYKICLLTTCVPKNYIFFSCPEIKLPDLIGGESQEHLMPYTIRAERNAKPHLQTRVQASSAVVLAMRWAEEGYEAISIECEKGRTLDIRAARERLARGLRF